MYQSGRAGDEAKKRKSPTKSGRVGITVNVCLLVYSSSVNAKSITGIHCLRSSDLQ